MAASLITKLIKDGIGGLLPRRLIDTAGDGSGPFTAIIAPAKPDGSGPVDLEALSAAEVAATQAVTAKLTSGVAVTAASLPLPAGAATDASLGGTAAVAAGDTGASTVNGFLRWLRDKFVAGITLAAGNAVIGQVGGLTKIATASLTRPADTTAYALGDLIANSTTAGSVTPLTVAAARANDATGMVRKARLSTSNVAWANNTVRVHLFKNAPTSTAGDNGAFSGAVNGIAAVHLGFVDVTFDQTFSDGVKGEGIPNAGSEINFDPAAGTPNIYALLEVRGSYTPASGQTFALAVETLQN